MNNDSKPYHYFGQLPNQTISEFMIEVRALSQSDVDYFTTGLTDLGYTITNPYTA